jgi:hypothetical protein
VPAQENRSVGSLGGLIYVTAFYSCFLHSPPVARRICDIIGQGLVLKLVVYVWGDAGRVDNVFGDRHLVCTNPSVEVIDEKIAAAA